MSPKLRATIHTHDCVLRSDVTLQRVANLWTEFSAQRRYAMMANGKEPQNPNKLVVAATLEMAKT